MIMIGCDWHTRFEPIARVDRETGERVEKRLDHESGEARKFYQPQKEAVRVGMAATGDTRWFAERRASLGHELVVGEAGKIRARPPRQQQHDWRDAQHLRNLLRRGDFPKLGLPEAAEREGRVRVEHRHSMVP